MPATSSPAALERPVTAAIRAGYAWTARNDHPQAWREIGRMTGVIMRALGPGLGPVTPAELLAALRQPLGEWLPGVTADPVLAALVILDADDQLTDATYEIGCDYTAEVLSGQDAGDRWLPAWRIHRAEQVEHAAFQALVAGTAEQYSRARRFVIDNPAGNKSELLARQSGSGLQPAVAFGPIPAERQHRGWWWPCPDCRWPMRVRGLVVRCSFPRHASAYLVIDARASAPKAQPMDRTTRRARARAVSDAVCVDESVWRHIVVPGVVEVRLFDRIDALPGADATLYPGKDTYDIQVVPAGHANRPPPWEFTLDVKDFASARVLASTLSARPVAAQHVVLPGYRSHQLPELRRSLPQMQITTENAIFRQIKAAATRTLELS
jgi:hypothetical protein